MKTIEGIKFYFFWVFTLLVLTNVKNQLFLMVFTSWLLNLFYLNNEEISLHARMCTQDIFQFNSLVCPIFFAQKFGHVLYIHELMGNPYHNKVLVPTH
jgi:hypothetical protein